MVRAAKCITEDVDNSVSDMARYRTYQFRIAAVVAHHMCYFFLGSISGTGCHSLGSGTRKGRTVGEDLAQAWEQMVFGGNLRFGQETVSKRKECEAYLALQDSTMRRADPRAIDKIARYRECLSLSFLYVQQLTTLTIKEFSTALPLRTVGRGKYLIQDPEKSRILGAEPNVGMQGSIRTASLGAMKLSKGSPGYSFHGEYYKTLMRMSCCPELVRALH